MIAISLCPTRLSDLFVDGEADKLVAEVVNRVEAIREVRRETSRGLKATVWELLEAEYDRATTRRSAARSRGEIAFRHAQQQTAIQTI